MMLNDNIEVVRQHQTTAIIMIIIIIIIMIMIIIVITIIIIKWRNTCRTLTAPNTELSVTYIIPKAANITKSSTSYAAWVLYAPLKRLIHHLTWWIGVDHAAWIPCFIYSLPCIYIIYIYNKNTHTHIYIHLIYINKKYDKQTNKTKIKTLSKYITPQLQTWFRFVLVHCLFSFEVVWPFSYWRLFKFF